jgi:hypothetical protein
MTVEKSLICLCLLILLVLNPLKAQQENESLNTVNISYFGNSITRPGLKLGIEYVLTGKTAYIKSNGKSVFRQLTINPNIGFYYHPENHTGLFLNSEFGYRIIRPKGMLMQISVGAGYLRTFLAAKTYEINDRGEIQRIKLAGSNNFMPCMNLTVGKVPGGGGRFLFSYFGCVGTFLRYPYNSMWLPSLVLEVGVALHI